MSARSFRVACRTELFELHREGVRRAIPLVVVVVVAAVLRAAVLRAAVAAVLAVASVDALQEPRLGVHDRDEVGEGLGDGRARGQLVVVADGGRRARQEGAEVRLGE